MFKAVIYISAKMKKGARGSASHKYIFVYQMYLKVNINADHIFATDGIHEGKFRAVIIQQVPGIEIHTIFLPDLI